MNDATPGITKGGEAVFPKEEYERRQSLARDGLRARGIDVLVVNNPANLFYLTGQQTQAFFVFQALLLPADGDSVFIIRQLELSNLVSNTYLDDIEVYQDADKPADLLVDVIRKRSWQNRRIAIDKTGFFLPIAFYEALSAVLPSLEDGTGIVEEQRKVKSPLELEKTEAAGRYVDAGQWSGRAALREGATDNDVAAALVGAAIAAGCEYFSMQPFVTSGWRSGLPHSTWRRRRLEKGDAVILEPACCHDRYHAALMRTAWIGKAPDQARRMMDVCQEGLARALEVIKPGNLCEDPHNVCQAVIDKAGHTEGFRKRVGYSLGIAFAPGWTEEFLNLFAGDRTVLAPGMVFHIPVTLRDWGRFTVGVSETVIVTEDGCRTLSQVDRAMIEV